MIFSLLFIVGFLWFFSRVFFVFARFAITLFAVALLLFVCGVVTSIASSIGQAVHAAHLPAGSETVVGLLLVVAAIVLARRGRAALRPIEMEIRLWRAALRLRRFRSAITAASLAATARVSYDAALAWLARHPQFMPSPTAAAR